jgi:hypothetical protein
MSGNLIFALTFLATFGGLVGLYLVAKSYRDASHRIASDRDSVQLRRVADGGRFIGGSDRPGEN